MSYRQELQKLKALHESLGEKLKHKQTCMIIQSLQCLLKDQLTELKYQSPEGYESLLGELYSNRFTDIASNYKYEYHSDHEPYRSLTQTISDGMAELIFWDPEGYVYFLDELWL